MLTVLDDETLLVSCNSGMKHHPPLTGQGTGHVVDPHVLDPVWTSAILSVLAARRRVGLLSTFGQVHGQDDRSVQDLVEPAA